MLNRNSEFARAIDAIDAQIVALVVQRNALVAPPDYDSDGEGECYFELPEDQGEFVYHAVAKVDLG